MGIWKNVNWINLGNSVYFEKTGWILVWLHSFQSSNLGKVHDLIYCSNSLLSETVL